MFCTIRFNRKNPSGQIWSNVMKSIHSGLDNSKFEAPKNLETATICSKTGLLAFSNCPGAYTEYFLKGTTPTSYCTEHSGNKLNKTNITENTKQNAIENPDSADSDIREEHSDNNPPAKGNQSTEPIIDNNTNVNENNSNNSSITNNQNSIDNLQNTSSSGKPQTSNTINNVQNSTFPENTTSPDHNGNTTTNNQDDVFEQ